VTVESLIDKRQVSLPNPPRQSKWNGSVIEMQEQERLRISQELHDHLGQRLALLEIKLSQLEDNCVCEQTAKGLSLVREQVGEIDRDVHRICWKLYPVLLEKLGLIVALQALCREFCQLGIKTEFIHGRCPTTVEKTTSLCLYRVVQEALHNVAKHARAKHAKVFLKGSAGRLEVSIEDSGVGFDRDHITNHSGLGLSSIEERVRRAGGRASICSTPGLGTIVRAVFGTFAPLG
jgi:signal transduction histidine kinase